MPKTEPYLRLTEILNHAHALLEENRQHREIPERALNLMELEIEEAKKIVDRLKHERLDIGNLRDRMEIAEAEIRKLIDKKHE